MMDSVPGNTINFTNGLEGEGDVTANFHSFLKVWPARFEPSIMRLFVVMKLKFARS